MTIEKSTKLNQYGVKDSANMWRTVKGEHFIQWQIYADAELVAAYRAAGVRCRRFVGELFINHADGDLARSVEAQWAARGRVES